MKVELKRPTWYTAEPTIEAIEGLELLNGVWREAATRFTAIRSIQESKGKITVFGIQKLMNQVIDERFLAAEWEGNNSRYRKEDTWVRITRAPMSFSEFFDAIKMFRS